MVGLDLEYYDVSEDVQGIDKKEIFRSLISELCDLDAKVTIYQNGELISLEVLDNWLLTLKQIDLETEIDTEREIGE